MALYTIETVTIIAVVVIGMILAIYLTILKRNGWLDKSNHFYRCPNQGCKKIFRKPVEVKDLSETPTRAYPACPECGADLRTYLSSSAPRKTAIIAQPVIDQNRSKTVSLEKKPEVKPIPEPKQVQTNKQPPIKTALVTKLATSERSPEAKDNHGCNYYFGYLANREKQEGIPETCLDCPKSLDCMLTDIKPGTSIQEMRKWYQSKA